MKNNEFVDTRNVIAFREAMAVLEDTEKGRPGLAVVWGQAGRGKTECARTYAVRTGAVYLRVEEDWTPRAMLARLGEAMGATAPMSTDGCKRLVIDMLEENPRAILVDEADRLQVGRLEHFRDIHDLAGTPVVLIGEQPLLGRISTRRRLWSRVVRAVEFLPIGEEDIIMLGIKMAKLKLAPEAVLHLHRRSEGDFRPAWLDLRDLARIAKANKTDAVDLAMAKLLPERKPEIRGRRHAQA